MHTYVIYKDICIYNVAGTRDTSDNVVMAQEIQTSKT